MNIIDFTITKDSHVVRLCEVKMSDDSKVYDLEIIDDDGKELFKTAAYDKKDGLNRYNNMVKALQS